MAKAIHSMIRVLDEARSVAFYKTAFNLDLEIGLIIAQIDQREALEIQPVSDVELTVNKGQTEAYDLGNGYGHIAFCVDDIDAEHARFTDAGLNPRKLVDFAPGGDVIARFFFVQDPDGYEIEVLQRHGRYQ